MCDVCKILVILVGTKMFRTDEKKRGFFVATELEVLIFFILRERESGGVCVVCEQIKFPI